MNNNGSFFGVGRNEQALKFSPVNFIQTGKMAWYIHLSPNVLCNNTQDYKSRSDICPLQDVVLLYIY